LKLTREDRSHANASPSKRPDFGEHARRRSCRGQGSLRASGDETKIGSRCQKRALRRHKSVPTKIQPNAFEQFAQKRSFPGQRWRHEDTEASLCCNQGLVLNSWK
jgi:hypothetical protein